MPTVRATIEPAVSRAIKATKCFTFELPVLGANRPAFDAAIWLSIERTVCPALCSADVCTIGETVGSAKWRAYECTFNPAVRASFW